MDHIIRSKSSGISVHHQLECEAKTLYFTSLRSARLGSRHIQNKLEPVELNLSLPKRNFLWSTLVTQPAMVSEIMKGVFQPNQVPQHSLIPDSSRKCFFPLTSINTAHMDFFLALCGHPTYLQHPVSHQQLCYLATYACQGMSLQLATHRHNRCMHENRTRRTMCPTSCVTFVEQGKSILVMSFGKTQFSWSVTLVILLFSWRCWVGDTPSYCNWIETNVHVYAVKEPPFIRSIVRKVSQKCVFSLAQNLFQYKIAYPI